MKNSDLLVAIICIPVSFIVGVLAARVFPEGMGVEWGSIAEWVGGLGAVTTPIVAWVAFRAWRSQLRETTKHAAATEIAEAASLTRYHFYDARNPLYSSNEFPDWYVLEKTHTDAEEAKGWAHLYNNRYQHLAPQILQLAKLRAKSLYTLGPDVAKALEALARSARWLPIMFQRRVEQLRVGQSTVASWPDQDWVARVKEAVTLDSLENPQDRYSLDFEKSFDNLIELLRPWL